MQGDQKGGAEKISTDAIAKFGQVRWTFPFDLPSGPNGTNPGLVIEHVRGLGSGELGANLTFNIPEISRFAGEWTHSNLGPLVEVDPSKFRSQTASEEALISRSVATGWTVSYRDGSRESFRPHTNDLFLLAERVSPDGHAMRYQYRADGMPDSMEWSIYRLEFKYEDRPDPIADTRSGALLKLAHRCHGFTVRGTPPGVQTSVTVRNYSFEYELVAGLSTVKSISRFSESETQVAAALNWRSAALDALPVFEPTGTNIIVGARSIQWKGAGRTDMWVEFGGDVLVHPALGRSQFDVPIPMSSPPSSLVQEPNRVGFGDVLGRGFRDLIVLSETNRGVYRYDPRSGFSDFEDWSATAPPELIDDGSLLVDLNGDGVSDLLVVDAANGEFRAYLTVDGVFGTEQHSSSMGVQSINLSDGDFVANISGTQWVDLVRVHDNHLEVAFGTGLLQWSPWQAIPIELPDELTDLRDATVYFADLTGNGALDLVLVHSGAVSVYFGCGGLTFRSAFTVTDLRFTAASPVEIDDFNGLGYSQILIWDDRGDSFVLDLWNESPPGELLGLDNHLGLVTSFEHRATTEMSDTWSTLLPSARRVLHRRVIEDKNDGSIWDQTFDYRDPVRMRVPVSRFFFSQTVVREAGSAEVKARRTRFSWLAPDDVAKTYTLAEAATFGNLTSFAVARDFDAIDDNILLEGGYEWLIAQDADVVQTRLGQHWRELRKQDGTPAHRMTTANVSFDSWGNVTQSRTTYAADGETRVVVTEQSLASSVGDVFTDRVMMIRQTDDTGQELSKNRYHYDQMPFGQVGGKGLLTRVESKVLTEDMAVDWLFGRPLEELGYKRIAGENGIWRVSKDVEIDGTVKVVRDAFGRPSIYKFDSADLQLLQATDAGGHAVEFEVNYQHARPASSIESGTQRQRQIHDDFGRTIEQYSSPYLLPVATFDYDGTTARQTRFGKDRLNREAYQLEIHHNGSGEVFKTLRMDGKGHDAYSEAHVLRGPRGKTIKEFVPYSDFAGAAVGVRKFDELDRVVNFTSPNGVERRHIHDGLTERIEVLTPTGNWRQHASKSLDIFFAPRITRSGTAINGGTVERVNDFRGNPLTLKEPSGRAREARYDLLGRKWFEDTPDRGPQIFVQDAGDQLREVVRRGRTAVSYTYSETGQVLQSTAGDTSVTATRVLGKPGRLGADKIQRVDHEAGTNIIEYDAQDRPSVRRFESPAIDGAIEVEYSYRPDGQISELMYFDSKTGARRVFRYQYDRFGRLERIPGILKKIEYDEAGAMVRVHYQNGVVSELGWRPDKMTMSDFKISLEDNVLHSEVFGFGSQGKIKTIRDHDANVRSFDRDDLSRVIREVLTPSLGQEVEFSFEYDDHGNILSLAGRKLTYDAKGKLTVAGEDAVTQDDLGRVTTIGDRSFSYDLMNQCTAVEGPGGHETYRYDHTGNATLSLDANGDLNWFAPDPTVLVTSKGAFGCVVVGELTVAIFRISNGATTFLHPNHRGDIALVTDAAGQIVRRRPYSLYGEGNAVAGDKGFEGKRWSEVGQTYHFGPRLYAPGLGRFLTPDPVVRDPDRSISFNAYAYSGNDPLSYRDATGLGWDPIGGFFDWVGDNIVEIIAVVVIVALIVVTGGSAAVLIGMAIGGIVGGVSAAQSGQNVLRGILVGAALGGLGAYAGGALAGAAGVANSTTMWGLIANGAIVGSANGAAMGLASGIAAGESADVVLEKALGGALIGGLTGGLFGAAEYGVNSYLKGGSTSWSEVNAGMTKPGNSGAISKNPNLGKTGMKLAGHYGKWALKTEFAHNVVKAVAPVVFSPEGYIVLSQTVSGVGVQDLDAAVDASKALIDGQKIPVVDEKF